ncbi:IclR family acetate operon transcriptional repressor [Leucobacter aridicollis]|nr:IclR family acetate operon transcriptional repressor [Leucobacter aridicollis]
MTGQDREHTGRSAEHETAETEPARHEPAHHAPAQHAPAQHEPAQHEPARHGPAQHEPAPSGHVQSVARAFALLESLADAVEPLSLQTIAERTGLAQPTAHRLIKTMQGLGYTRQTAAREYGLGPGLIALGNRAAPELAVRAQPLLRDLEELSQETANLVVLDGTNAVYVAQQQSRHQMRMFTEVGRRVLPHAAGAGKAMLATLSEARVRAILEVTGLPRYTETTRTTVADLLRELRETRGRGYALDDGEREVGVRCIAVAVPGSNPPAALSVSGPAARITDDMVPRVVEALQGAAARLSGAAR